MEKSLYLHGFPLEELLLRFQEILRREAGTPLPSQIEIIDRGELSKRLGVTPVTIIRLEKKKKIPSIRLGSSVRYNWPRVIEALENSKKPSHGKY